MFKVGEYVVFATNGVCKVEAVGKLEMNGMSEEKLYYTLAPIHASKTKIFTPIDNDKVIMRRVLSRKAVLELIDDVENIEIISIEDDKAREEAYKEAIKKCDCRELIKIIKTLNLRKEARLLEGKKVINSDERYLKIAEENLYEELALPLEIDRDEMSTFIIERVEALKKA